MPSITSHVQERPGPLWSTTTHSERPNADGFLRDALGFALPVALLGSLVLPIGCGGGVDGKPIPPPTSPDPPAAPPPPPSVPNGLRVSAIGEDFIEWRWNADEGADGYEVQFSADESFDSMDDIIGRTAEELSYRRENLAAGTGAYLRVRSIAEAGQGRITSPWSDPVTGTTAAPEELGTVWARYVGGGRADRSDMARLPRLFNSALELGRHAELDVALGRLVSETPPLPASANAPEARLAAEVASTLGSHEWPETHPWAATFPGLPDLDAHRVTGSITVDASWDEFPADARRRQRRLPLGFYAPPGGLVTVSVPQSHATGELAVEAGQDHNDLRLIEEHTIWRRAPALRRVFQITAAETAVTNAYGGSLALIVPESYRGTVPVTIEGAIRMAVYTAGQSSLTDWRADLNAGAPQAIIQKLGGIRLVVSAEAAHDISDPGEVAAFWDGFQQHHAELAGEPVRRAFEGIWIFDPHVGWGYANAGWLTINYPFHGEHWVLLPGTAEGREYISTLAELGPQRHSVPPSTGYSPPLHGVDWWLFGHELGHQWQTEDWTGHGITEVGVNLFTMYTLNYYVFGGDDSNVYAELPTHGCAAPLSHAALASQRWSTAGACERLALYRQLISEFGWDPMRRVFHSYYDPAYLRSRYGGHFDGFAIRFSTMVQRDLVSFFRRWEYPLSRSAESTIRGFGFEVWLPPGW